MISPSITDGTYSSSDCEIKSRPSRCICKTQSLENPLIATGDTAPQKLGAKARNYRAVSSVTAKGLKAFKILSKNILRHPCLQHTVHLADIACLTLYLLFWSCINSTSQQSLVSCMNEP